MDVSILVVMLGLLVTGVQCKQLDRHHRHPAHNRWEPQDLGPLDFLDFFGHNRMRGHGGNFTDVIATLKQLWQHGMELAKSPESLEANQTFSTLSPSCSEEIKIVGEHLAKRELWAWKFLDAWGKPPSGLSQMHQASYGDFRMCKELSHDVISGNQTISIKGRFCSLYFMIASDVTDVLFGFCVPQACHKADIERFISKNVIVPVYYSIYCHKEKHMDLPGKLAMKNTLLRLRDLTTGGSQRGRRRLKPHLICLIEFQNETLLPLLFIITALVATLVDYFLPVRNDNEEKKGKVTYRPFSGVTDDSTGSSEVSQLLPTATSCNLRKNLAVRVLLCFSIQANFYKLFDMSSKGGAERTVDCLNGIRVLTIIWIINSHVLVYSLSVGFNSNEFYTYLSGQPFSQFFFQGSLSTDTFFTLSAILVTYGLLSYLETSGGKMRWVSFYVERFIRLTPPFYVLYLFNAFSVNFLDDSPSYWRVENVNQKCHKHWWKGMLLINNFFKDKCLDWAWYVAVEFQLYAISPLFIIPLYKKPVIGWIILVVSFISSTVYAVWKIHKCRYKPSFNLDVKHDTDYTCNEWDDIYAAPHVRVAGYLVGITAGYFLYRTKMTLNVRKMWIILGWCVSASLFLLLMFGLLPYAKYTHNGQTMSDALSIAYVALYRPTWAIWISWIVVACATGNGGFVNSFLSLPIWKPFARVTYCVYLFHVGFVYYDGFSQPVAFFVSNITVLVKTSGMVLLSFLAGFPISLILEAPFLNLKKLMKR